MNCTKCGKEVPEGTKSCPACGSLRALVCRFHGALGPEPEHNASSLLTGPVPVILLLTSLRRAEAGRRQPADSRQQWRAGGVQSDQH
jgi:predicted amidophosphoribosyltransferase